MTNKSIDKSPTRIQNLFSHVAPHYDQNNDIISLFLHRFIKHHVISQIPNQHNGVEILDLCTGTGDIPKLLKKRFPNSKITGVDFCEEMLNIAAHKNKHKNITFTQADCLNLPFQDNSFDIVTISFGLRNTADYDKAISEIARVLRPNGIFVHVDFGKEAKFIDKIFLEIVKFVAQLQEDESYVYLLESKQAFPAAEDLIKLFATHGLKLEKRQDYLHGLISAQFCSKKDILQTY